MFLKIKVSANTMGGVMFGDVAKVFAHLFTQCSLCMSNILWQTHHVITKGISAPEKGADIALNWTSPDPSRVQ